jgi:predicted small lipoprotein YifL
MTAEFKSMVILAALLGLAIGALLAYLETVREEHMLTVYVWRPDELPPADVSALHEEVRRIQREGGNG